MEHELHDLRPSVDQKRLVAVEQEDCDEEENARIQQERSEMFKKSCRNSTSHGRRVSFHRRSLPLKSTPVVVDLEKYPDADDEEDVNGRKKGKKTGNEAGIENGEKADGKHGE